MRRKTSLLPTRVYKYALRPPTLNADALERAFEDARVYYNRMVTAENRRRHLYRRARSRIFPLVGLAEEAVAAGGRELEAVLGRIRAARAESRSRGVPPELAAEVARVRNQVKSASAELKRLLAERRPYAEAASLVRALRKVAGDDEELLAAVDVVWRGVRAEHPADAELEDAARVVDEEATRAVKALRPTLYWGTYLLVEAACRAAAAGTPGELSYDETPPHLLSGRVGVHWAKGISVADLMRGDDTLLQVVDPPEHRLTRTKKWRPRYQRDEEENVKYCVLRIRVGTTPDRKPLWAELPLSLDRPLPPDGRVKDAYVTRRPLRERNPWQYHLCVVVESGSHERVVGKLDQDERATAAVNFGWRLLDTGALRVATINRDGREVEHVELPAHWVRGHEVVRRLQGLLDEKFEAVKEALSAWLAVRGESLPEAFVASFEHVGLWKSQHRLCELARYWQDHRVEGDDEVYPAVATWRERYLHLHDWASNQRRRLLRQRDDLYGRVAKDLVTGVGRVVVDTFRVSDVARRAPSDEVEEGGPGARRNRVLASPGELRERVLRAAQKYHCEVVAAPTVDGTRRCNTCGSVQDVRTLVHECSADGATWDQDVNNTDNLLDAAASGEVVPLVRPAKTAAGGSLRASGRTSLGAAHAALGK